MNSGYLIYIKKYTHKYVCYLCDNCFKLSDLRCHIIDYPNKRCNNFVCQRCVENHKLFFSNNIHCKNHINKCDECNKNLCCHCQNSNSCREGDPNCTLCDKCIQNRDYYLGCYTAENSGEYCTDDDICKKCFEEFVEHGWFNKCECNEECNNYECTYCQINCEKCKKIFCKKCALNLLLKCDKCHSKIIEGEEYLNGNFFGEIEELINNNEISEELNNYFEDTNITKNEFIKKMKKLNI